MATSVLAGGSASARAGLIHLHLGTPWPTWIQHTLTSAAHNTDWAFYFVGPELDTRRCDNCHRLAVDEADLLRRVERHLGGVKLALHGTSKPFQKLCDLKPMWPALFPELVAKHEWIGFGDYDILYGDLDAELARLLPSDELLVPLGYFPTPLANGNLLLMRTTDKMVQAFRRSPSWRAALEADEVVAFDEWWGREAMWDVYQEMALGGELRARPTQRPLAQDTLYLRGAEPQVRLLDQDAARLNFTWRDGALWGERRGACVCTKDLARAGYLGSQTTLSGCAACQRRGDANGFHSEPEAGEVLEGVQIHRKLELLGVHFTSWKNRWKRLGLDKSSRSSTSSSSAASSSRASPGRPELCARGGGAAMTLRPDQGFESCAAATAAADDNAPAASTARWLVDADGGSAEEEADSDAGGDEGDEVGGSGSGGSSSVAAGGLPRLGGATLDGARAKVRSLGDASLNALLATNAELQAGKPAAAARQAARALDEAPYHVTARSMAAAAASMAGQHAEAAEHFEAALLMLPDHPGLSLALAKSLLAMGRHHTADVYLERVLANPVADAPTREEAGELRATVAERLLKVLDEAAKPSPGSGGASTGTDGQQPTTLPSGGGGAIKLEQSPSLPPSPPKPPLPPAPPKPSPKLPSKPAAEAEAALATEDSGDAADGGEATAVAVAFADGCKPLSVHAFVASFLEHARPGSKLMLWSYDAPPDVSIYPEGRVEVVRSKPAPGVHLASHRFSLWRAWLEGLPEKRRPKLLLNTDVTDVVFQGDPFVDGAAATVHTGEEHPAVTLGDGSLSAHYNLRWLEVLRACKDGGSGEFELSQLATRRVSCSGFSAGGAGAMLAYWRAVERTLKSCAPLRQMSGGDQGAHQYLLYVKPPKALAFELLPMRDSPRLVTLGSVVEEMGTAMRPPEWANTPGADRLKFFGSDPDAVVACKQRVQIRSGKKGGGGKRKRVMCYDERGRFYNSKGKLPAVVHQYNRLPEMVQRVASHYAKTAARAGLPGAPTRFTRDRSLGASMPLK